VEQEDVRVREEKARIANPDAKEDLVIVDCVVKKYDGEDPNPPETTESDRPVIM
jgi:ABC-type multidrug transport system ATPase subunit